MNEYNAKGLKVERDEYFENENKRLKIDPNECLTLRYKFLRSNFVKDIDLPKSVLLRYSQKCMLSKPTYETWNRDKLFRSVVTFDGKNYTSSFW